MWFSNDDYVRDSTGSMLMIITESLLLSTRGGAEQEWTMSSESPGHKADRRLERQALSCFILRMCGCTLTAHIWACSWGTRGGLKKNRKLFQ